ncbi:MAG: RNA 3'-terminal phosphate cyclase [Lentisphaerae bacterium]|nr:RNA 3'-terminal phosphate cyclase [Lentisphaerota bacterium]
MITIDGAFGEGGGQILRTALAVSLVTGKAFRIDGIRAKRGKPGLLRQHLTAVNAAVEIGNARVAGNSMGSLCLTFEPAGIRTGAFRYAVGTAGSATLVLQTLLPPLLTADSPTELTLEGGTHNPYAPPFDFLQRAFLPLVNRMGPTVTATLERPGFYPAGGGKFTVRIEPVKKLVRLDLMERGAVLHREAVGIVSQLPRKIADMELAVLRNKLSWEGGSFRAEEVPNPRGPGNIVMVTIQSENVTEVFTGFGERGVPADRVALTTVDAVRDYVAAGVPVGRHLADQLLIPMALAGGGRFRTLPLSRHSSTNIEILKQFIDVDIAATKTGQSAWEVAMERSQLNNS